MPAITHDPRTQANERKVIVDVLHCPFRFRPDVMCQAEFRNTQLDGNGQVRAQLAHHLANAEQPHPQLTEWYCFHGMCHNPVQPNQAEANHHFVDHQHRDAQMRAGNPDFPLLVYRCTVCDARFWSQVEVNDHYREGHHAGSFLCGFPGCGHGAFGQQAAACDHYERVHLPPRPPRRAH